MARADSRDTQLDATALIQAHIDGDNQAADTILRHCDLAAVANFLAASFAGTLTGLARRGGEDTSRIRDGLGQIRDDILSGG